MGTIALVGSVPKDVIQALIQLLNETDVEVKRSAIRALGEIGPKAADAIPVLQEMLKDADPNLRRAAGGAGSPGEPGRGGGRGGARPGGPIATVAWGGSPPRPSTRRTI